MTNREWLNQQPDDKFIEFVKSVDDCDFCMISGFCQEAYFDDDGINCYETLAMWLKEEHE